MHPGLLLAIEGTEHQPTLGRLACRVRNIGARRAECRCTRTARECPKLARTREHSARVQSNSTTHTHTNETTSGRPSGPSTNPALGPSRANEDTANYTRLTYQIRLVAMWHRVSSAATLVYSGCPGKADSEVAVPPQAYCGVISTGKQTNKQTNKCSTGGVSAYFTFHKKNKKLTIVSQIPRLLTVATACLSPPGDVTQQIKLGRDVCMAEYAAAVFLFVGMRSQRTRFRYQSLSEGQPLPTAFML